MTYKKKNDQVKIRRNIMVLPKIWAKFMKTCHKEGYSASEVLEDYMKTHIVNHGGKV